MSFLSPLAGTILLHFRGPLHDVVNEGYDKVLEAAFAAIDGQPDADGELNPFEAELSPEERQTIVVLLTNLRPRLNKEVDRILDGFAK